MKNCVLSGEELGNIKDNSIQDILASENNLGIRKAMLADEKPSSCVGCYKLEEGKKSLDIVSSRVYYLREFSKDDISEYGDGFSLKHVDVRWQNTCNFACVYCGPEVSSRWEQELGIRFPRPDVEQRQALKDYIFSNVHQMVNVYLAGGEPLLMTENEEFLDRLFQENPNVSLRINTNLSKTHTKVFDKVLKFKNVHWTVSVESMGPEFEYIRYGGNWNDFQENLSIISSLNHKISFNMLHFLLNPLSIFDCIDHLRNIGFHPNSFVLGPITGPRQLDIRNLPGEMLQSVRKRLDEMLEDSPGYLLDDGYKILRKHLDTPFEPNLNSSIEFLSQMDARRRINGREIFKTVYEAIERQQHG